MIMFSSQNKFIARVSDALQKALSDRPDITAMFLPTVSWTMKPESTGNPGSSTRWARAALGRHPCAPADDRGIHFSTATGNLAHIQQVRGPRCHAGINLKFNLDKFNFKLTSTMSRSSLSESSSCLFSVFKFSFKFYSCVHWHPASDSDFSSSGLGLCYVCAGSARYRTGCSRPSRLA